MRKAILGIFIWLAFLGGMASAQNKQSQSFDALTLGSPLPPSSGGTGTASPGLVAGSGVTITGSWPNQTVNAAAGTTGGTQQTPPLCPWAAPSITGTTYYVDNSVAGYNGSSAPTGACATADAAAGTSTSTAWCTIAHVKSIMSSLTPGSGVLFKGGDTWTEQMGLSSVLGTSANPIVFGSYGTGRPILDETGNKYGIDACNGTSCNDGGGDGNGSNHDIIINNFEIKHASNQAITFQTSGGTPSNTGAGTADSIYDITVQNLYVHNSGPGAPSTGAGVGTAQTYDNQIDFETFSQGTDNTKYYCNTGQDGGGWNMFEVHYDTGAVVLKGNVAGTNGHACSPHGCIDTKGIGSLNTPALRYGNTSSCGLSLGFCPVQESGFYIENINSPEADVVDQNNLAYDTGVSFQVVGGYSTCNHTPCAIKYSAYNNTAYDSSSNGSAYAAYLVDKASNPSSAPLYLDVRNNILDGALENVAFANGSSTCTADYNNQGGSLGHGTLSGCLATTETHGQLNVNPLYQSVSAANFQLQASSPDLNVGLSGLTTNNPNIGAFGTGATSGAGGVAVQTPTSASVSGTYAMDWTSVNNEKTFYLTLTAPTTLSFTNAIAGNHIRARVCENATGGFAVTWPTINWSNATQPSQTTTASKCDWWDIDYNGSTYTETGFQPNEAP